MGQELVQQKENAEELIGIGQPENPTWHALQECQIMLPLGRLLQLVPRFTEGTKDRNDGDRHATGSSFLFKSGERTDSS